MWLDYGVALCQPDVFDKALAARKDELTNVKIRSCLSMRPRAVLEGDPDGEHFFWFSWHFSGYDRKKHDAGRCNYMPLNLGEVPDYYRRFIDPVDIVILKTCPMDENGYFNFSAANLWHRAVIERAKMVIVEVSRGPALCLRRTERRARQRGRLHHRGRRRAGAGTAESAAERDRPRRRAPDRRRDRGRRLPADRHRRHAQRRSARLLLESGVRDLGIHTEMLTDGIVDLYKAGRITGARKTLDPGKIVYTFALGSRDLYAIDRNRDMLCCPGRLHQPAAHHHAERPRWSRSTTRRRSTCRARRPPNPTATATSAAPAGSCSSCAAPMRRKGGKSFICLSSTYDKRGERRSRIVLDLTPGNIVTTPRTDVMYVVTEYGMVNLKGKVGRRARQGADLHRPSRLPRGPRAPGL